VNEVNRTSWIAVLVFAAALAVTPHPLQAQELFYYVDDGRVVITNTPSRADIRTVPGFSGRVMQAMNGNLPATRFDPTIRIVAGRYDLDPDLIKAVAYVESAFKPDAVSPKGAVGLMQLMPATAAMYGVTDLTDPGQNLNAGARHLRSLMDEFNGDLTLVLAAYNAGSGAVRRSGGVPAYRETRNYVRRVQARLGAPSDRRAAAVPPGTGPGRQAIRRTTDRDGTIRYSN
jgi:hypothetical protein